MFHYHPLKDSFHQGEMSWSHGATGFFCEMSIGGLQRRMRVVSRAVADDVLLKLRHWYAKEHG
jgi:hypothetical protein